MLLYYVDGDVDGEAAGAACLSTFLPSFSSSSVVVLQLFYFHRQGFSVWAKIQVLKSLFPSQFYVLVCKLYLAHLVY